MEEEGNGVSKDKNVKTEPLCNQGLDKTQPTNFLDRFLPPEKQTHHNKQIQNSISSSTSSNHLQEPDLNLRLSLGRSSGSSSSGETSKQNPLTKSSSNRGIITLKTNNSSPFVGRTYICNLPRAYSLPARAEQVQRVRVITMREIQSMRRIQAKNRLIAKKQRNHKEAKEKEKDKQEPNPPMPTVPSQVAAWAAASTVNSPALSRALLKIKTEGLIPPKRGRPPHQFQHNAPGSFNVPAVPRNAELVITAATSNGVSIKPAEPKSENPPKKARVSWDSFESNGMDVMRQMPSVSATGDGPNGRRVEGFLYAYMKGKVSIICICHGSFLSPAEFVKHAGGRDVPNPMKHITVYSTFAA